MRCTRYRKLATVLLGLSPLSVNAADEMRVSNLLGLSLEELMQVEVSISTASRQPISRAPSVVTVITQNDIKATGATNLVDVLEGVPGIHVRANQFGNRPLIQFRGANGTQTLLMVNGIPMKDLLWGFGIFWKGLPVSIIDRVEIIRGPGSALFGADASAGVINVITKSADTIRNSEVGARVGSFNSKSVWGQYGGSWGETEIGLTLNVHETDGHDPRIKADRQTSQDETYGTSASYAPADAQYGWRSSDLRFSLAREQWRLMLDYMSHDDLEIGLTGAGVLDPVTEASDSRYSAQLQFRDDYITSNWGLDAKVHYEHLQYSSGDGFQENPRGTETASGVYPDGIINRMRAAEHHFNVEVTGLFHGFEHHTLRIGSGYTWQDLYRVEQYVNSGTGLDGSTLPAGSDVVDVSDTPYAFAPERTRYIRYLFLQDIWDMAEDWELTAGARLDNYSDFGSSLNPRLALVWQTSDRLTSKLLYGEAFRAPSYRELFADTSFTFGNEDLDPERSRTVELSFAYVVSPSINIGMNLYDFKQSDLIRPDADTRQFTNTGDHTIQGIELEAHWQASRNVRLAGNVTTRRQDDSEYRAVTEPNQEAYLRLDWAFLPAWHLNLQNNWIGERERLDTDTRDDLEGYVVTDMTLRHTTFNRWDLAASVRNLFDSDAREYTSVSIPDDFPLPERNLYLEASYQFP